MAVEYEVFIVESRLPFPEYDWEEVFSWPDSEGAMTKEEAEEVAQLYRRAMPGREYRVRSEWRKELEDEDIPF